jgi:hypothetical protein
MIDIRCWEGMDLIFRKTVNLWTKSGHQGRMITVKYFSWVIGGLKLWLFNFFFPNEILTMIFGLEASRPNKRRVWKPSIHLAFS